MSTTITETRPMAVVEVKQSGAQASRWKVPGVIFKVRVVRPSLFAAGRLPVVGPLAGLMVAGVPNMSALMIVPSFLAVLPLLQLCLETENILLKLPMWSRALYLTADSPIWAAVRMLLVSVILGRGQLPPTLN